MLKHCLPLCILVRTIFYFICKLILIQIITTFLWKKLSFDSLVSIFFFFLFFIIISIILNFSSYFNLVFGLIFSYTIWGSLMDPCMYILKFYDWSQMKSIHLLIQLATYSPNHQSIHLSIHPWIKRVTKIDLLDFWLFGVLKGQNYL